MKISKPKLPTGARESKNGSLAKQSVACRQGRRLGLITGAGIYVDDIKFKNQAYLGIVRSPYAHAKIKNIDFSKARSSPDFIASLSGEELLNPGVGQLVQFPMQKPANRY